MEWVQYYAYKYFRMLDKTHLFSGEELLIRWEVLSKSQSSFGAWDDAHLHMVVYTHAHNHANVHVHTTCTMYTIYIIM